SISVLGQYYDWTVWQVYIPVYLMSTAQHCCRPLKKSVLMDYAPRHTRARWNSLDSITRFGWSGSAILGGYLVDKTDYPFTFLITAILQRHYRNPAPSGRRHYHGSPLAADTIAFSALWRQHYRQQRPLAAACVHDAPSDAGTFMMRPLTPARS
ncbi:hypothetical protein CYMTET_31037, partial [Cymbomonas tetramitiformis]